MTERLADAPIQPEFRETMNALAATLDKIFNGSTKAADRKTGFVLIVFPFSEAHEGGRANYISNANRRDVVTMLKEQIRRFEGQPEMKGHG